MKNRELRPSAGTEHDDMLELDRLLARLGLGERAEVAPGFEDRVFAASRAVLVPLGADVASTGAGVDRLAAEDAAAGRSTLEAQAFELSREAVASGRTIAGAGPTPAWRLVGDSDMASQVVIRTLAFGRLLRIAAAVVLAGAGVMVVRQMTVIPNVASDPTLATNTNQQLAENIDTEMAALFEIVGSATGESATNSVEFEHDTAWMDDLFSKESL